MRQVVTVQVGQCGNQLGPEMFGTLAGEAVASGDADFLADVMSSFFVETAAKGGRMRARAVLIDTEPKVIACALDTARRSPTWDYNPRNCYSLQSGAANNWAFGRNHMGPIVWSNTENIIRREHESMDLPGGVVVLGSLAGGTGSGVGSYITEQLRDSYPKSTLVNTVVWPYSSGEVIVQNYNACLSLAHMIQDADAVLMVENDHMHDICTKLLRIDQVTFQDINRVISRHIANVLLPSFHCVAVPMGGLSLSDRVRSVIDPVSHLCCNPSYKLLNMKAIPQIPEDSLAFSSHSWPSLLKYLRQMLIVNAHMDESMDWSFQLPSGPGPVVRKFTKSVANMLFLRGGNLASADPQSLEQKILYPSWNTNPLLVAGHNWPLGGCDKSAALLSNSQAVIPILSSTIEKALQMFETRAYLHHYAAHSIDEAFFSEAFVTMEQVLGNYTNIE
ncbi:tubulin delta chain [Pelomyxa schiedti]|nr:tubulin delta chain [Pelomyxa schiedti]